MVDQRPALLSQTIPGGGKRRFSFFAHCDAFLLYFLLLNLLQMLTYSEFAAIGTTLQHDRTCMRQFYIWNQLFLMWYPILAGTKC